MNDTIAIIIARGGSRRLSRKNVLPFAGKPLVEWTIIQARCIRCLTDDDIYLSTDDDEIAAIGERHNIHIIRRPDWPDADKRSAMPVYAHALDEIRKDRDPKLIFSPLPTCPCRLPGDFDYIRSEYFRLKALYPTCREVIGYQPRRETIIARKVGPVMRNLIWDKYSQHFNGVPTIEIKEAAWWDDMRNAVFYDTYEKRTERGWVFMNREIYWVINQWFQGFDIDDADTFALTEAIFKQYILKGQGEEIYWNYKSGRDEQ